MSMVGGVRDYVRDNGPATNREIADALNTTTERVIVATQWLAKTGEFSVTKPGNKLVYAWADGVRFAGARQALVELQGVWR